MMKYQSKYSRRSLLKALGAGAALLPLLESDPADAACLINGIKRLFVLAWPDGMLNNVSPWPGQGDAPDAWQLSDFQASLEPYKNDLLLLDGLDYDFVRDGPVSERDGHAALPGMLTGARYLKAGSSTANDLAGGPSIDQYIGTKLRAGGYQGLTSLNVGAFVDSTARLSWSGAGQSVIPDYDPYHVFNMYFAGPVMSASMDLVKRSILDYVGKDLNRFMTVAAFGADLTRIVVMQIGDQGGAHLILSEAGFMAAGPSPGNANVGDQNGLQAISHRDGPDKAKCDAWFNSQIAYLLGQLKSVSDPASRTLLDNSVFVGMNNMRTGQEEYTGVPAVLAGSCAGYFKTGRSLAFTATPNNGLLVALCNAMGTPVQTFGEPTYGGELTSLRV